MATSMQLPASSNGITDLSRLIGSMTPTLQPGEFVFAKLPLRSTAEELGRVLADAAEGTSMLFRESESWTAIVSRSEAERRGWEFAFPCRQITLAVHSSLEAVGFLAAVTTRLAREVGIGVNPVSGYYHDHLFVPSGRERHVLAELERMAAEGRA